MGQTVQMRYGKASFNEASATYTVFRVEAPFVRTSGSNTGKRHGYQNPEPVGRLGLEGNLYPQRVEHENGTILLVQASWMRGKTPWREAGIFVRLRADGATLRIDSNLPQSASNIYGPRFTALEFNGDLLSVDDLKFHGIEVYSSYVTRYMDREEVAECFAVSQIAPERAPRPTVALVHTSEGTKRVEIAAPPKRRLFRR